jgi:hypothetical protein
MGFNSGFKGLTWLPGTLDVHEITDQTSLTRQELCVRYSVATKGHSVYGGDDAVPDFPLCIYSLLDSSPALLPHAN